MCTKIHICDIILMVIKMILKKFGQRIKELRHYLNLSQDELASASKTDRVQISKIENGLVNVTLETIEKIAISLKTELKNIFDFTLLTKPKPFVKWAGGKTQLLDKLMSFVPKTFNTYYEPFVGGGALLFSLLPKNAVINDNIFDLCLAYKCFQNEKDYNDLTELLKVHEQNHSEEYYYFLREQDRLKNYQNAASPERAARLIYLNKACYNGLYRVNKNGFNNVPFGKKQKVITFNSENFEAIKKYFLESTIKVLSLDFTEAVKDAKENDFVYFDPPYDSYPDKNNFTSYNLEKFTKEDQIRLRDTAVALTQKKVKVMLSNHNTPFIRSLYKDFNINVVQAKRNINSNGTGRGEVEEVIITNY